MTFAQFTNIQGFTKKRLRADFMAAIVVTAIAIPESLGFAAIVGLPIQTGLYCALIAPIVFALTTSSKHLVIGADSATAALVASGAASIAVAGSAEYTNAVAVLAILSGVVLLTMAALRFGFLADLISKPVFIGLLAGIGLQLILGKVPELLGLSIHGATLPKLFNTIVHIFDTHLTTLVLSVVLFGVAVVANRRKLPGSLLVLLAGILLAATLHLEIQGVKMVGDVPSGLPGLAIPNIDISLLSGLFPTALAIAAVVLAQSTSVIRNTATRYDEPVDDNRDLAALGLANITSALSHGFAVNGSPPRTAAAEMSGGRSQWVNVFMALLIAGVLLLFSEALKYLPISALAVVIVMIGLHLFDVSKLKHIYTTRRTEFWIASTAMLGVVILGVEYGVALAVALSIIERLRRQYRPDDAVLLQDGQLAPWADERLAKHHKYRSAPTGTIIYRFAGSIFFENADYFKRRVITTIEKSKEPVSTLIIDAGAVNDIDYTAAEMLKHLCQKLYSDDIRLIFAHVPPTLNSVLSHYGLLDIIGENNIYPSLEDAVFDLPNSKRSTVEMVKRLDISSDDYVVIGGGVLEALKLRDTNDVDLVVSEALYKEFVKKGWREYIQDDGKRILSHHGYQIMLRYVGKSLRDLKPKSFIFDDICFMSIDDLMAAKQKIGRQKDLDDLKLLRKYQRVNKK